MSKKGVKDKDGVLIFEILLYVGAEIFAIGQLYQTMPQEVSLIIGLLVESFETHSTFETGFLPALVPKMAI